MNKSICFLIGIVLAVSVFGVGAKVMILELNYDDGQILLLNNTIKYGFFPDRRYEPDYGYKAEMISLDGFNLYTFRFKAPNEIFVDGTDETGEISGGKVILPNVNFALTVPYYEDIGQISIYSPGDEKIASFVIAEKSMINWEIVGWVSLVAVFVLVFMCLRIFSKKET